jgi:hypothetical protein
MPMSGAERQRRYRERHHGELRARRWICALMRGSNSTVSPGTIVSAWSNASRNWQRGPSARSKPS